jgi:hypothetical protein
MAMLRLAGFSGMWPIRDVRALPDNAAAYAMNIRADGGAYLKPARTHQIRVSVASTTNFVYSIYTGTDPVSQPVFTNSFWWQHIDPNTDVVRSPLVNDSFQRYYWASPSGGLKYAPKSDILAGSPGLVAGVPTPPGVPAGTGPGVTPPIATGAEGEDSLPRTTRSYAYTWINVYGEESQPSPPGEGTGFIENGAGVRNWTINNIQNPPVAGAGANFQTIRLYRTVTALSGVTQYYKVTDIAVGAPGSLTAYVDAFTDLQVTGNVSLESTFFAAPPAGIQGIAAMPNGILVGWIGNTLYFSENFRPHAWPVEYQIAVEHPVVGLGVYGNTCVVCTTGNVFLVQGTKSNALSLTKTDAMLSCVSRLSIVAAPEGVYYASDEGLVLVGAQGISVVTRELISREQWQRDFVPNKIRAMYHNGEYVGAIYNSTGGFRFSPTNPSALGVTWWGQANEFPVNLNVEAQTGRAHMLSFNNTGATSIAVFEWEKADNPYQTMTWKSKEYQTPWPMNFRVGQAYFDVNSTTPLHLKIWATLRGYPGTTSKTLIFDQNITTSGQEFKLPSGFRADIWEVELSGAAALESLLLATTTQELRNA